MPCSQCGHTGFVRYTNNQVLCVECHLKFQQAQQLAHERNAQILNHRADQMDATAGVSGVVPRYQMPGSTVLAGPVTQPNIQIHDSVVGAVNTGSISEMNVALDRVQQDGNPNLATALQNLAEAILGSPELSRDQKQGAVEHLS